MGCAGIGNVFAVFTACLLQLGRGRGWLVASAPPALHQRQQLRSSTAFSLSGYHVAPTGTGRRRKHQCAASRPLSAAPAAAAADSTAVAEHHQPPRTAKRAGGGNNLQSVDFTTALLMSRELEQSIVPARVENAYQMDAHNVALQLRTLNGNMWLHVCWHPKGAR